MVYILPPALDLPLNFIFRALQLAHVLGGSFVVVMGATMYYDFKMMNGRAEQIFKLHESRTPQAVAATLLAISLTIGAIGILGFWPRLIDGVVAWLQAAHGAVSISGCGAMALLYTLNAHCWAVLTQRQKRTWRIFAIILAVSFAGTALEWL